MTTYEVLFNKDDGCGSCGNAPAPDAPATEEGEETAE